MEQLALLFVGKPVSILMVAAVFHAAYLAQRYLGFGSNRHPRSFLMVTFAWALYAAWEGLVLSRTPEANIRVDLMVIWPTLLVLSIWFTVRAFK